MKHKTKTRWMAICLAAGLCAGTAGATTITGTDYASWLTAISGAQTDLTLPTSSPWTTTNDFAFTSPNNDVASQNYFVTLTRPILGLTTLTSSELTIAMPSGGETALYLSLYNNNGGQPGGGNLNVTLSDGETFATAPYDSIFWFSSPDPITSLTVASTGASNNHPFIASLSYAESNLTSGGGSGSPNPTPVPEPATILLVSAGALIFFGARRRWFCPRFPSDSVTRATLVADSHGLVHATEAVCRRRAAE